MTHMKNINRFFIFLHLFVPILIAIAPDHSFSNEQDDTFKNHYKTVISNIEQIENLIPERDRKPYLRLIEELANCNVNTYTCPFSGEAAHIYGSILLNGVFGPPDPNKAIKYLQMAVLEEGMYSATLPLGNLYLNHPKFKNEEHALFYFMRGYEEGTHITKMRAANLIGNFYLKAQKHRNFSLAAYFYKKSLELWRAYELEEFPFAAENLSRMYLVGDVDFPRNLKNSRKYSQLSTKNGGHDIFEVLINEFPIDDSTTFKQITFWLEELAATGRTEAFLELVYFNEFVGDANGYLKWLNLCSLLCDRFEREIANSKLETYSQSFSSSVLSSARKFAGDWFNSRYSPMPPYKRIKELGKSIKYSGDLHVFLIGVNEYSHSSWQSLTSPIADVELIGSVLKEKYGAKIETQINPTKEDFLQKLMTISASLSREDSLIIYFSGHGESTADLKKGFWILSDGNEEQNSWLDTDELKNIVQLSDATNILIIADSCFSGVLSTGFKGIGKREVSPTAQQLSSYLRTKSIVTLSSGGLVPVPDAGMGKNSIFAFGIANYLSKQKHPFTVSQMHGNIKLVVAGLVRDKLGYSQTPWIGNLPFHGHVGPDFVFIPHREQ